MNNKSKRLVLFSLVLSLLSGAVFGLEPVRVLVYSGANNHKWAETTPVIKNMLAFAGMEVSAATRPGKVTAKELSQFDVIVSNWNNFRDKSLIWPEETKKAFLDFINNGGGHVMVHAGGSSFYDWGEYHKIVASWGKGTGHGPVHEFDVNIKSVEHPICRGLQSFQVKDELWRNTKFPEGSKVLMTGFSSKKSGGKDTNEPILTVSDYGKGRCVNFMLGHDAKAMENQNFKNILVRSVLWAANKNVSEFLTRMNKESGIIKTHTCLALIKNGKTVWQFNFGRETSKPYFHPIALADGTVLTEDRPADHPWHHGLWFTWKYINGVNFWEENRKTGESNGKTEWSGLSVNSRDGVVKIGLDLTYSHRGQKPILSEKRKMVVYPADDKGVYYIDWESKFTACSDVDVTLDRTPIPGDKGGKAWGGYAGLSVRLNGKGNGWAVTTEKEPITFENGTYRGKAKGMEFGGVFDEKAAGITILDHPDNLNAPTPWYAIAGKPMKYFSPAVICFKPHTLKAGESFTLKYRVIVHPEKWDADMLKEQIKNYSKVK